MHVVKYRAVKETHHHPYIGTYTAWGIMGWRTSDKERTVIAYIPDVFLCKKDAQRFASLCTQLNIDILHLSDVVKDYLAR